MAIVSIVLLVTLTNCVAVQKDYTAKTEDDGEAALVAGQLETPVPVLSGDNADYSIGKELLQLALLYDTTVKTAVYEPESGCYTGAHIMSDKMLDGNIKQFEKLTQTEHAIYSYNMRLGSDYPEKFVLSCIANGKTPNITVYPPESSDDIYSATLLIETAKAFAEFKTPMFVQFYPFSSYDNYDKDNYIAFFRLAKEVFSAYAPQAALVWNVFYEDAFDCAEYYPGDNYVDWVGLSIYSEFVKDKENKQENKDEGLALDSSVLNAVNFFYYNYQQKKPVMLSELAVSHYSTRDNTYQIEKTEILLNEIYSAVKSVYPRIKAVIYMNINFVDKNGTDNFLITEDEQLTLAYKNILDDRHFLNEVSLGQTDAKIKLRSVYSAYGIDNDIYIPARAFVNDLLFTADNLSAMRVYEKTIYGETYYPAFAAERALNVYTEHDAGLLYICR